MSENLYRIRVFGAFSIQDKTNAYLSLPAKCQAIVALLAVAPNHIVTRARFQALLWGNKPQKGAAANLRNALSSMRRNLGPDFDRAFDTRRERILLRSDRVQILAQARDGEFLDGLDIADAPEFDEWLLQNRQDSFAARPVLNRATVIGAVRPEQDSAAADLLPTIAVLPFQTRRAEKDQAVIGHMIAEDLSATLSRSENFSVISHLTMRNFGSPTTRLDDVTGKIQVDYLLSGKVCLNGDRIEIYAQLTSVLSGLLAWSRTYTGTLRGFLAGDLGAITTIARHAGRTMTEESLDLAKSKPIPDLPSHVLLMGAVAMMQRTQRRSFAQAKSFFDAVIARVPNHPVPHAWLGNWHMMRVNKGLSVDAQADFLAAEAACAKALDIDPTCSLAMSILGLMNSFRSHRFDLAERLFDQALEHNPNEALAYLHKAMTCAFQDRTREAVRLADTARRLSPLDPQRYFFHSLSATAYLADNNDRRALELAESSLKLNRSHPSTHRVKTIALHRLGRGQEAQKAALELRRLEPQLTVSGYLKRHPASGSRVGREWAQVLKEAGIPK